MVHMRMSVLLLPMNASASVAISLRTMSARFWKVCPCLCSATYVCAVLQYFCEPLDSIISWSLHVSSSVLLNMRLNVSLSANLLSLNLTTKTSARNATMITKKVAHILCFVNMAAGGGSSNGPGLVCVFIFMFPFETMCVCGEHSRIFVFPQHNLFTSTFAAIPSS